MISMNIFMYCASVPSNGGPRSPCQNYNLSTNSSPGCAWWWRITPSGAFFTRGMSTRPTKPDSWFDEPICSCSISFEESDIIHWTMQLFLQRNVRKLAPHSSSTTLLQAKIFYQFHFQYTLQKDCLLTGQEQACTRITRLFVWLVLRLSPCALVYLYWVYLSRVYLSSVYLAPVYLSHWSRVYISRVYQYGYISSLSSQPFS